MSEYSKLAKGYFTSTGGAQVINTPFLPDFVEFRNLTKYGTAATSQNVIEASWDVNMGATTLQLGYNATPTLIGDTVTANGISVFNAGQLLQYGPSLAISGITKAAAGVVTTVTNHGLTSGDVVVFSGLYQAQYTTGMPQLHSASFTVTVTGLTTFTIPWNTNQSAYTALSGSPTGAVVRKVLYPSLYFPGAKTISGVTTGTTTTVFTSSAHNFVVGQEVALHIPSQWGITQLNSLPNTTIPGQAIYGYVIAVTDYQTVVLNINSVGYTAYTSNIAVANLSGVTSPQIVAVGTIRTGGVSISAGSNLYPSPVSMPIGTTTVPTIGGPAIQGSYVNNSSAGFIIGVGAGTVLTTSVLCGAVSDVIYWKCFCHDISLPV